MIELLNRKHCLQLPVDALLATLAPMRMLSRTAAVMALYLYVALVCHQADAVNTRWAEGRLHGL